MAAKEGPQAPANAAWAQRFTPEAATLLALIAVSVAAIVLSRSFEPDPRMFPQAISITLIVLSLFRLGHMFRAAGRDAKPGAAAIEVPEAPPPSAQDEAIGLVAIVSIVPLVYLLGLSLAAFVFTAAFIRFSGRRTVLDSLTIGAITGGCVWWASFYLLKTASAHGLIIDWVGAWMR